MSFCWFFRLHTWGLVRGLLFSVGEPCDGKVRSDLYAVAAQKFRVLLTQVEAVFFSAFFGFEPQPASPGP